MQTMAEADRRPRATWSPSQFVLLPENRSAAMALRLLAKRLGPRRQPLLVLLAGPPGSGKSYLADDLHQWAATRATVVRQSAADWATPEGDDDELRHCDLLIVEDLQHLPTRAAEAFAALLDYRAARGLSSLVTTSRRLGDLDNLSTRLQSRLGGGLLVTMRPFGPASRRRFLKHQAASRSCRMRREVLDWLAEHTAGSARQLLAALEQVRALCATMPSPPQLDAVRARLEGQSGGRRTTLERVTERVGRAFGLDPELIRGRDRQPGVLWARQVCMYLARSATPLSLAQIGIYFGRDHTTVRHACVKVAEVLKNDSVLAGRISELEAELGR